MLDSDRRLADHFGGKVSGMNGRHEMKVMSRVDRCIWATMSCATCFPNFGKIERSARWRLRLPLVPQGGQAVGRHAQGSVQVTIALHVTNGTGSVTEGTSGTRLLDMSEWLCCAVFGYSR